MTTAAVVAFGLMAGLSGCLLGALAGLAANAPPLRRLAHALIGTGSAAGLAASLLFLAGDLPPMTIGGIPLAFGAPLVVDRLAAFFLMLVHLVTVLTAWFGDRYVEQERAHLAPRVVVPLLAVFCLGMQGVLLAGNVAAFVLCWEAMSLASFFLVMADGSEESRRAALLYLAVAQFGAGALMVGLGILGDGSPTTALASLGTSGLSAASSGTATALVLFAFTSKAGLAPFHAWLPEAHPRAPSHVSALMSGVMLKVAVYGLLRVQGVCWPDLAAGWGIALTALGLGGAVVAVISANLARDIKRILAWSSVENLGLVFTMFGFATLLRARGEAALADAVVGAMLLHLFAHALFKPGLFLGAGAILCATRTAKIEQLGGLAARMPRLSAAMLILALSAAALPPSGAFVAEFLLLEATVTSLTVQTPSVAVTSAAVLLGMAFVAGLAVFAMVRLFAFVFLAEPRSTPARLATEPAAALRGPSWILAAGGLALGVGAAWLSPLLPRPLTRVGFPAWAAVADAVTPTGPGAATLAVPTALAAALALALGAAWCLRRLLAGSPRVRPFRTWDCGQPIDATMEYTATAFSAPVRFFLRDIVRAEKRVVFQPVVPTNPWIRRGHMEFHKAAGTLERLYFPLASFIEHVGGRLKRLQNGVIQFYIALILATLLLAVWVAL